MRISILEKLLPVDEQLFQAHPYELLFHTELQLHIPILECGPYSTVSALTGKTFTCTCFMKVVIAKVKINSPPWLLDIHRCWAWSARMYVVEVAPVTIFIINPSKIGLKDV